MIPFFKKYWYYFAALIFLFFMYSKNYGPSNAIEGIATLFCMFIPVLNIVEVYGWITGKVRYTKYDIPKTRIFFVGISSMIAAILFVFVLSRKEIVFAGVFSLVVLACLLLYDLIFELFRR